MADIVLATINAKWIHPSLALRLLKANLGDAANRSEIIEFALRQPLHEKVNPILAARPRLLGLSVSIWNHKASLELLKALDEKWNITGQKPLIVLGGPEVSWLHEDSEIFRHANYVIRGEGEDSFRSLCYRVFHGQESADTNGNTAVFLESGDTAVDLNRIKPAYQLYTDEDLEKKLVYVEASRGCPFGCEFCQGSLKNKARDYPLEAFLAEMKQLLDRGARTFKFLDRSFNLDTGRAAAIMEFFLERIGSSAKDAFPFCVHFEMVPSRFPPELRELIRRFPPGTLRLELGIQTLNRKAAELIHRSWAGDELEALKFLRAETNAILHVDLIAGLPGEDLTSFGAGFDRLWQTLSFCGSERESRFEIQLGILKCLPGTPIMRHNETHGMKYSPEPPYELIETAALSAPELDRLKNFARFWETIVNRNSFPDLIPHILPPGENVFGIFMDLSDKLLEHFGKNWGIDKEKLKSFLENERM